jgi:hypothetical protein
MAITNQGRALAGKGTLGNAQIAVYSLPTTDFHDVKTGNNGYPAGPGYDFVTGLGSPKANLVVRDLVAVATSPTVKVVQTTQTKPTTNRTVQPFATSVNALMPVHTVTVEATTSTAQPTSTTGIAAPVNSTPITVGVPATLSSNPASFNGVSTIGFDDAAADNGNSATATPVNVAPVVPAQPAVVPPAVPAVPQTDQIVDSVFIQEMQMPDDQSSSGTIGVAVAVASDDSQSAVNPAAVAGVAAFLGGSWWGQAVEAERKRFLLRRL